MSRDISLKNIDITTVYGPLPSWYLESYLGLDPLTPFKLCTFNCVYCPYEKVFYKEGGIGPDLIMRELDEYLSNDINFKYLLIEGRGDPILNPYIKDIIKESKRLLVERGGHNLLALRTCDPKIAMKRLGDRIKLLDLMIVKADAVSPRLVSFINGYPLPRDREEIVHILRKIKEYTNLAIKITLLRGCKSELNFTPSELRSLVEFILDVSPNFVIITTPTWLKSNKFLPLNGEELREIASLIVDFLSWEQVLVYGLTDRRGEVCWKESDITRILINSLLRRPLKYKEIERLGGKVALNVLSKLIRQGLVKAMSDDYYILEYNI